jgi:hypothetical protein
MGFAPGQTVTSTAIAGGSLQINSTSQVVVNPYMFFDFHTNIPRQNYSFKNGSKLSLTTITARIPVTVPFMATQVYQDFQGANAMFESHRDHFDSINISLKDEYGNVVNPGIDWHCTLAIETWADSSDSQTALLGKVVDATTDLAFATKLKLVKKDMDKQDKADAKKKLLPGVPTPALPPKPNAPSQIGPMVPLLPPPPKNVPESNNQDGQSGESG